MRRAFRPIQRIVDLANRNSWSDWELYDMIDELTGRYFFFGFAVGIVAGVVVSC